MSLFISYIIKAAMGVPAPVCVWLNKGFAIALHFVYYNFGKQHKTLRITPAMAAGLTKRFMSLDDIVNLVPVKAPEKKGAYKKII